MRIPNAINSEGKKWVQPDSFDEKNVHVVPRLIAMGYPDLQTVNPENRENKAYQEGYKDGGLEGMSWGVLTGMGMLVAGVTTTAVKKYIHRQQMEEELQKWKTQYKN